MAQLPRMRTKDGLWEEIHRLDPGSQVSKHLLYQIMLTGKVRTIMAGNKRLANLDEVLLYLSNPPADEPALETQTYGTLRRIEAGR
jgi:hypothetical protein